MPLKINPPLEKEFVLELSDKELGNEGEPTTVKIRQAREGENIERLELWKKFERRFYEGGDSTVTQEISPAVIKRKEVFLTLVSCNIETEEGKPLFKFPLKEAEFNRAWSTLPSIVADEIHDKVLEVNLDWSVSGEAS